ncbi:efflux RND transporter periplasmic adaptor subunit [Paraburkholderia nemoris]|uniref:Multidrug resistance protein MdtA n=1 Tax=Paraburkholderia nemoris TaxID=2793076 RepID=A0ABM8R2E2_9BURK|nr:MULTISPECIES: efflux RND transporter periplasmic adaptor subunit [Paraburkholderia]MBK3810354.1 efflux RND transporter periplasmic adaptor subunit [Paraburkholderia aspalathi]CAE6729211.1 Multidrug resistance protein MdtA [Paraburkholderia nemoris]CAE6743834.1 Multidrug resistance protein MdtA [Paraburkholderia nemoris]
MNNPSLPPDLGDRSEPAVEADRAADAARAADTVHATEAAQAPPFAQPASGKEYSHPTAAGTARSADMTPSPNSRRRAWPFALAGLAAALLIVGIVPRLHASAALTQQTQAQSVLSVSVVAPRPAPAVNELLLPGAVTPFAEASIYARTSGYLADWNTDIGVQVKSGQTLATIDAPDLDAQLRQARADEATAQANFDFAKTTAQRWQEMLKTQSVAQQDADTKVSDMEARRAMLASAQANVAHLAELVSYEKITAPFDGTITARNVDVGALVTAGGTPGTAGMSGELFHIQQTGVLRVFVDVPQNDAPYVTPDTGVYLTAQQYPGRRIAAKVARTTGSIDPSSRTLRVEVDVDNKDRALMPGAYVQVHLQLQSTTPALELPVSALLFRPDGVTVAVVDGNGRAALKTVHIGRDFGTHVEITTGLAATDRVIDNPGDSLSTGQLVQIAPATHS